jgi:2,5-diketo-D-gluconate reductase A
MTLQGSFTANASDRRSEDGAAPERAMRGDRSCFEEQIESWGPFVDGQNDIFANPVLSEVGAAYGKSVTQVILRWLIQRDVVVIPKSVRPERMAENLDVFDFELSDDDAARIAELDTRSTLFFNHDDPEWVSRLSGIRAD